MGKDVARADGANDNGAAGAEPTPHDGAAAEAGNVSDEYRAYEEFCDGYEVRYVQFTANGGAVIFMRKGDDTSLPTHAPDGVRIAVGVASETAFVDQFGAMAPLAYNERCALHSIAEFARFASRRDELPERSVELARELIEAFGRVHLRNGRSMRSWMVALAEQTGSALGWDATGDSGASLTRIIFNVADAPDAPRCVGEIADSLYAAWTAHIEREPSDVGARLRPLLEPHLVGEYVEGEEAAHERLVVAALNPHDPATACVRAAAAALEDRRDTSNRPRSTWAIAGAIARALGLRGFPAKESHATPDWAR